MERHRYLKMTFESSVESVVKTSRAVKLTTDYTDGHGWKYQR